MRIERIDEHTFLALTAFGTVRVSDGQSYRSYYIDNPVPKDLALALSLLGVNVADSLKDDHDSSKTKSTEFNTRLAVNDTKIVIHCRPGERGRIEKSLDDIFSITQEHWRNA